MVNQVQLVLWGKVQKKTYYESQLRILEIVKMLKYILFTKLIQSRGTDV